MWGWGPGVSGYCGSMSIQTAGIYYGNWLSQDAVRGTSGGQDAAHEILLDLEGCCTAIHACRALQMNCTSWSSETEFRPQHIGFLEWSRQAIRAGEPVIFGVYMRGHEHQKSGDHIVPMVGFDDTGVYLNDLHSNLTLRYEVDDFVRDSQHCTKGASEWEYCLPASVNYGMRVHGNLDANGELLPLRLSMSSGWEPDYSQEDQRHAAPVLLTAQITLSGLQPGSRYALLRYDDPETVPDRRFLDSAFVSRDDITAAGEQQTLEVHFPSNSTIFFRCVREDGYVRDMLSTIEV
ncbi:unnamed protein product [Polarella glacialis]|nr:unnamed protein product [Polarella glacialis]